MDLDKLIATLQAGGASQDEIDKVVESYTQNKYQPKPVGLKPNFYLESDKTVTLGREKHQIRLMNVDDLRRVLPKLIEVVRFLMQEQGAQQKVEEVLEQVGPMGIIGILVQKVIEMNLKGDYPDWFVSVLEEIAHLASNEQRQLTPEDLISLPPSQLTDLLFKLVEVNQQDFLTLWASVPPAIRLTISTLASRLTSAWKNLSQNISQLENSFGGQSSSGNPVSFLPSEKKAESPKRNSVNVASPVSSNSAKRSGKAAASKAS